MRTLFPFSACLFAIATVLFAVPVSAQSGSTTSTACGQTSLDYTDEVGLTQEERIRRMDQALMRSLNQYDECQDEDEIENAEEEQDPSQTQQNAEGGGTAESEGAQGEASSEGAQGQASSEGAESQNEGGGTASAATGDISGNEPGPAPGPSATTPPPGVLPNLPSSQGGQAGQSGQGSGPESGSSQASGMGGDGQAENLPAGSSSAASGDMAGTEPVAPPQRAGSGVQDEGEQAGSAGDRDQNGVVGTGPRALPNGKLPEDIPPADNDSVLEAQIRQAAINEPDPELKKKLWNEYRRYKGLPQVN